MFLMLFEDYSIIWHDSDCVTRPADAIQIIITNNNLCSQIFPGNTLNDQRVIHIIGLLFWIKRAKQNQQATSPVTGLRKSRDHVNKPVTSHILRRHQGRERGVLGTLHFDLCIHTRVTSTERVTSVQNKYFTGLTRPEE